MCSFVLESKRLLPLDVETNLGSTRAYKVLTQTQRFFNISFGKLLCLICNPGHNVDAGAKVVECFWEVHHADGDRDDGASWIASLSS